MLNENSRAALYQARGAETAEEIIGVLTAISVVSKRMAKKLALLEERTVGTAKKCGVQSTVSRSETTEVEEGVRKNAKTAAVSANAN